MLLWVWSCLFRCVVLFTVLGFARLLDCLRLFGCLVVLGFGLLVVGRLLFGLLLVFWLANLWLFPVWCLKFLC